MRVGTKSRLVFKGVSWFFLLLWCCSLVSCVPRVNVLTDTYSDKKVIPQGFQPCATFAVIEPSSLRPSVDQNVLLDREVRYKIEKILVSQGYRTSCPECADYLVHFFYGMNSDTKMVLSPFYLPGTTKCTQGKSVGYRDGEFQRRDYFQTTTTSGTVDWLPVEVPFNTRWLVIKVFDKARMAQTESALLWNGSSISIGASHDLRDILNYLLVANLQFFGQATSKQICGGIYKNASVIRWLQEDRLR
ncbi:MAG: hypothetical protein JSS62_02995 [Verrucomicrobia bacterium]|nr:hypothetical protein [Verrucomicrobiota bacterium]MBS0646023.1 hypothetical protein [Verrucomicrobiota bacterium]